ncbi:Rieske (2Fe-2S) protein (plasmid) [Diaphorobacter sp. HDW4B]|uniref:Rieske (2Fe-2S) protein n=1 Tax=Diaphorobacter sp. HDW4B TaxID=2714925 RepID=UPI00140D915A|nr:Rieske (2Fe-2S) protein [Diaphorobacter sp. HDW4B]QIL74413.1 Rieske (2Fe-2S) protein [Diaphorobacter sp. HDW4B]
MRLCHVSEVHNGVSRGFDAQGVGHPTVFVVRVADQLRAWRDACPHHGTPLPWRTDAYLDASGTHIVCAAHGALFDPLTGICTLGPCLGDALTPVPIEVHPDGSVYLTTSKIDKETTS